MKSIKLIFTITLVFFIFPRSIQSQESINNYKYIIVPDQFEFLKSKDKYQVNSLTKFLFNKYGYTAFMVGDEFPDDLDNNRCLALTSDVHKVRGGFLNTKIQIDLLDCNGKIIMSSRVGVTRVKEYNKAFNLAIRDAFVTYQNFDYSYQPLKSQTLSANDSSNTPENEKIKQLEKEVEALKKAKEASIETKNEDKLEEAKEEAKIVVKEKIEDQKTNKNTEDIADTSLLYAQPINNGFQLVDTTPKKVMVLLKTPKQDVFSVKDRNAIVYKENGKWYYSEVTENGNVTKELNIKF